MTARILVVDDVPANLRLLEARLSAEYFDVMTATSGEEALAVCNRAECDLVLLDVMMPGRSGYEVCKRLRERPEWKDLKIIMLSAKGRDAEVSRGLSLGADVYITKPFSTRDLMAKIQGLLDSEPAAESRVSAEK